MNIARSIFISYRRRDSVDITGRIHDRLVAQFGADSVFKDVDAIPFGADFRRHLEREVSHCPVMLAIIGPTWLSTSDTSGQRRLDDPFDWVRVEIEAALKRDSLVIPVLVGGAELPQDDLLPASLKGLAYRQSAVVRHDPDFHSDMDRLLQRIESVFSILTLKKAEAPAAPVPEATPYNSLIGDLAAALTAATETTKPIPTRSLTRRRWLKLAGLGLMGGGAAVASRSLWPAFRPLTGEAISQAVPDLSTLPDQIKTALAVSPSTPVLDSGSSTRHAYESVTVNEFGIDLYQTQFSTNSYEEVVLEGKAGLVPLPMVAITSGQFLFGAPVTELGQETGQKAQTIATVSAFWISIYPITQSQWRTVAELPPVNRFLEANPSAITGDDHPVEQVSWHDAVEFCERLSRHTGQRYRLPTEAEWEYACRAKTTTPFHTGQTLTTDLANYDGTHPYQAEPVGQFRGTTTPVGYFGKANDFGLYDMHGNVQEWCADHWEEAITSQPQDSQEVILESDPQELKPELADDVASYSSLTPQRLVRGGSWQSPPQYCRSAYRTGLQAETRRPEVGFRIVRDMMETYNHS